MQFYWTTRYEHSGETLAAEPGTALLVVQYGEPETDHISKSVLRVTTTGNDLASAAALAHTLIDDRPTDLLRREPDLVFQVQQTR
jgi:hypothetical protein